MEKIEVEDDSRAVSRAASQALEPIRQQELQERLRIEQMARGLVKGTTRRATQALESNRQAEEVQKSEERTDALEAFQERLASEKSEVERKAKAEAERLVAERRAREEAERMTVLEAKKEQFARAEAEHMARERRLSNAKVESVKAPFLFSWIGRTIFGTTAGIVSGLIMYSLDNSYYVGAILILAVSCGMAGLLTYPHKSSLIPLTIGFFAAGFVFQANVSHNFLGDFIGGAVLFGLPGGALVSRILYWLKVIK